MAGEKTRDRAELTMAGALLMAVVTIFALLFAGTGWEKTRGSVPSVSLDSDRTLQLAGARGEEVSFYVTGKVLGKVRWRSNTGLFVELDGQRFQAVAARRYDWGGAINVGKGPLDDLKILGAFRVPDLPGAELQTVTGTLTGEIVSAQASGSGFYNRTDNLRVPVTLEIVSAEKSARLRAEREGPGARRLRVSLWAAAASAFLGICLGAYSRHAYAKLR